MLNELCSPNLQILFELCSPNYLMFSELCSPSWDAMSKEDKQFYDDMKHAWVIG